MANSDRPNGFKPLGSYKTRKYTAGSKIVPGEFVRMSSDGKVDAVAAGETILGLAMSLAKADNDDVQVIDAPQQEYVGQADESDFAAQTDVGNVVDVLATAENSTFNAARMEIDSDTAGTASGQLLILDLQERPDNAFGEFADVIVRINEHQTRPTSYAGI